MVVQGAAEATAQQAASVTASMRGRATWNSDMVVSLLVKGAATCRPAVTVRFHLLRPPFGSAAGRRADSLVRGEHDHVGFDGLVEAIESEHDVVREALEAERRRERCGGHLNAAAESAAHAGHQGDGAGDAMLRIQARGDAASDGVRVLELQ